MGIGWNPVEYEALGQDFRTRGSRQEEQIRVRSYRRSVDDFGGEYVVRPRSGIDGLKAEMEVWREAGGSHVSVVTMGMGLDSIDAHVDYLAKVAEGLDLA